MTPPVWDTILMTSFDLVWEFFPPDSDPSTNLEDTPFFVASYLEWVRSKSFYVRILNLNFVAYCTPLTIIAEVVTRIVVFPFLLLGFLFSNVSSKTLENSTGIIIYSSIILVPATIVLISFSTLLLLPATLISLCKGPPEQPREPAETRREEYSFEVTVEVDQDPDNPEETLHRAFSEVMTAAAAAAFAGHPPSAVSNPQ